MQKHVVVAEAAAWERVSGEAPVMASEAGALLRVNETAAPWVLWEGASAAAAAAAASFAAVAAWAPALACRRGDRVGHERQRLLMSCSLWAWASVPPCGSDRAPSGKSSLCLPLEHDQPLLAIRTQSQRAKPGQQPRRISDRRTLTRTGWNSDADGRLRGPTCVGHSKVSLSPIGYLGLDSYFSISLAVRTRPSWLLILAACARRRW